MLSRLIDDGGAEMTVQVLHPPGADEPRRLVLRCRVGTHDVQDVTLAHADEVATFAIQKRTDEHLSGRLLLEQALRQWGFDASVISVERTEHRAPYLTYIPGVWKNTSLPSISLGHSDGWAYVALVQHGWQIGVDAESKERGIQKNAFDMMAKGEELNHLNTHPELAIEAWVGKEAVQKSLGLGMHLNPRFIEIPIGVGMMNISIEDSKIQLEKWIHEGAFIALALTPGLRGTATAEDALLQATQEAMIEGDWGVGCKTTRSNA